MATIKTGKEENMMKIIDKIKRKLETQPDYIAGYYYNMRNSGKTESYKTHEVYVNHVIKFLNEVDKDIKDIKMDDINKYISDLSIKPDGSLASGSYLVAVYSALKKFFKYLVNSERIDKNPMNGIERPASKKPEMVERTYLTQKEIRKLFKTVDGEDVWTKRDRAILVILFFTGIRNTALTEINVQNVDFENSCIYIVDKGTKAQTCYLSEDKMNIIKEWIDVRNKMDCNTDALFISQRRQRICQGTSSHVIQKASEKIGHRITPHKARASLATNAIKNGVPLYEVSKILGHSSTQVTADCYIQDQDEKIKEASLKASNFMKF